MWGAALSLFHLLGFSGTVARAGTVRAMAASSSGLGRHPTDDDPIVQYVVVRKDLLAPPLSWPVGSVVAQACHACLAVVWEHRDDEHVTAYLAHPDTMRKVIKECKSEAQLRNLADRCAADDIAFKLWVEQPEDTPTALALKPYPRSDSRVARVIKKFSLLG